MREKIFSSQHYLAYSGGGQETTFHLRVALELCILRRVQLSRPYLKPGCTCTYKLTLPPDIKHNVKYHTILHPPYYSCSIDRGQSPLQRGWADVEQFGREKPYMGDGPRHHRQSGGKPPPLPFTPPQGLSDWILSI